MGMSTPSITGKRRREDLNATPGILSSVKRIFSGLMSPAVTNGSAKSSPFRSGFLSTPRAKTIEYDSESSEEEDSNDVEMKPQEKKKEKEIKKQKKEKKKEKKKNKTKTNDRESQGSKQSISDSPKSSKPVTSEWTTASKPQLQDILKQKLREGISTEEYNQIIKLLQKSNPSTPIGTSNLSSPFSGQVPIMF